MCFISLVERFLLIVYVLNVAEFVSDRCNVRLLSLSLGQHGFFLVFRVSDLSVLQLLLSILGDPLEEGGLTSRSHLTVDFNLLVDSESEEKDSHVREDHHVAGVEPFVSFLHGRLDF